MSLMHLLSSADPPRCNSEALIVSKNLPPVPKKLAERIWRNEYIEFELLLPTKLGSPEPTLGELFTGGRRKERKSTMSIQEWVVCFNTYLAILTLKDPTRVKDLLAYSSLIVKASADFEGECWRNYDQFFRRQAAAEPARYPQWGEIEPCMWTQHFGRAAARPTCGQRGHENCARAGENSNTDLGKKQPYTLAQNRTLSRGRRHPSVAGGTGGTSAQPLTVTISMCVQSVLKTTGQKSVPRRNSLGE